MSEHTGQSQLPSNSDPFAEWAQRQEAAKKAISLNKANIIEALKLSSIARVTIQFDGAGDSGGIESITCEGATDAIPNIRLNEWATGQNGTLVSAETTLPNAIENFAYELLAHTHEGWENDDGAYGEIVIDVVTGTVEHEHNTRLQDCVTDTYTY
jgi:hypothetical protein